MLLFVGYIFLLFHLVSCRVFSRHGRGMPSSLFQEVFRFQLLINLCLSYYWHQWFRLWLVLNIVNIFHFFSSVLVVLRVHPNFVLKTCTLKVCQACAWLDLWYPYCHFFKWLRTMYWVFICYGYYGSNKIQNWCFCV